jgi:hypothetical protein
MSTVAYMAGLLTLPALALAGLVVLRACFKIARWFADRGMTVNLYRRRGVDQISDYVLRNNIWWERSWGPVFAGGWYRDHAGIPRFTRWIGLGRVDGPCVTGYRMRERTP